MSILAKITMTLEEKSPFYLNFKKNIMENFKLPEKWAIKTHEPEFYEFFNQTIKPKHWHDYTKEYATDGFNCFMHSTQYDVACLSSDFLEDGYTEITFEQLTQTEEWKAWKNNKYGGPKAGHSIINNGVEHPASKREIISYKAPFDMYINTNIEVIKDTIFTKRNLVYWNEKCNVNFPAELVEKYFIPVYKETKESIEHEMDLILGCYSTSTFKDKEEFNRVMEKLAPLFKKLEELK